MSWHAVIGLEVHVRLATQSKLFCGCSTAFGASPNAQTCPVCLGLPGSLPVLNRRAVELAVRTGLALNCDIPPVSTFARKNYFYPDLPKAWQTSQFDQPVCGCGWLETDVDGAVKRFGITRAHLEEDAGKLTHAGSDLASAQYSLVDYNRVGSPLIEIVSEPDLRSADDAHAYLTALRSLIRYVGASDCSMEEGSLRCDANISVRPAADAPFGTKVELKNMNSFKAVRDAIRYEIMRQIDVREAGQAVVQETRLWHPEKQQTITMRSKEEAHDYRYFPEPDLIPIAVPRERIAQWRQELPELPRARAARLQRDHALSAYDAGVLTAEKTVADYFEQAVRAGAEAKAAANLVMGDIAAHLNKSGAAITELPLTAARLAELLALQSAGKISGKQVKELLPELLTRDVAPAALVQEKGMEQISDTGALEAAAQAVIAAHPGPAADVRAGKQQAVGFLVGQLMKQTRGQANPQLAQQIFRKLLA